MGQDAVKFVDHGKMAFRKHIRSKLIETGSGQILLAFCTPGVAYMFIVCIEVLQIIHSK